MRKNSRLPNFHNLGIHLRILLIVNLFFLMAALLLSKEVYEFLPLLAELSAITQPIVLLSILSLYVSYPLLVKFNYELGLVVIMALVLVVTFVVTWFFDAYLIFDTPTANYRTFLFAGIITAIVMYYFSLQQRAYSPAIAEARLQALQARIRPHFLFNSINAVLSLIRNQPKRAESALEDMADLFRVLMAENRDLVPLENEIALCRQYLNIESLRLEDRLKINWHIDDSATHALIPPLILQPLLENAVYHGIEPLPEGGEISVIIASKNKQLDIEISNPFMEDSKHHHGNKMALKNIIERLRLHFDLEASLKSEIKNQRYYVRMHLPLELA